MSLTQPGDEIALFAGTAFALQYVAAVAAKPFFDLGRIAEAPGIGRRCQWPDTLADAAAAGLSAAATADTLPSAATARVPGFKAGLRIQDQDVPIVGHAGRTVLRSATQRVVYQKIIGIVTVPHPISRFLLAWFLVVLQTAAPFIHAHAEAVQLNHAGFLHVHQGGYSEAGGQGVVGDEHGVQADVAQGMPLYGDIPLAVACAPLAASLLLPCAAVAARPGAGLPAPPPLCPARSAHILPHALAPPPA